MTASAKTMGWLLVALSASAVAEVPGELTPPPTVEAPPPVEEPPAVESPSPAVESPSPAVESPSPAVESPSPAVESPSPAVESPSLPVSYVEVRHVYTAAYGRYLGQTISAGGDLDLGVRWFLTGLPEDAELHRQLVAFFSHRSFIDLGVGVLEREYGAPSLTARLFLAPSTGFEVGLDVLDWQQGGRLHARLGLLQYLGRSLRLEARTGFDFYVQQPQQGFFEVGAGATFVVGDRWLPSVQVRYQYGTFTHASSVALTLDGRCFVTRRLALRVQLSGDVTSPVVVYVSVTPVEVTGVRTQLHFETRGSIEWEWNRWISTALSALWTWTRVGEFAPQWGVGPGADVRVRF